MQPRHSCGVSRKTTSNGRTFARNRGSRASWTERNNHAVGDSFKDHFSSVAGNYAAFRPDYPRELFEWLASVSPARNAAWDCATGNGQAATGLAEFFQTVFA